MPAVPRRTPCTLSGGRRAIQPRIRGRLRGVRSRVAPAGAVRRPHPQVALALDLREADDGDRRVIRDLTVVELPEKMRHFLRATDLRVVVLDLPRREVG